MRELFAARAAIAGDAAIYFPTPPVAYAVASDLDDGANPAVVSAVPSGTLIYGDGAVSLIKWTGVVKESSGHNLQRLWQIKGASRVLIRDLAIEGDNDPFVAYWQNQSSAIELAKDGGTIPTDVLVRDCLFRSLIGFPYHSSNFIPRRCHALRNRFVECANGLNVNADYSIQWGNVFDDTESIEYAGYPGCVALNSFRGSVAAFSLSLGGRVTKNFEASGVLGVGNSLASPGGQIALQTSESFVDGWLQGNVVEGIPDLDQAAMQIGAPQVSPVTDYKFDRATIVDNYTHGSYKGFVLQAGDGHVVARNRFGGTNISGGTTSYSVGQRIPTILDNTFESRFTIGTAPGNYPIQVLDNVFLTGGFAKSVGALDPVTAERPTGVEMKLFGDVSECFATLQVRNWDDAESVTIAASDLAAIGLREGDRFHFLHPYYLLGAPYQTSVFLGGDVRLGMRAVTPPGDWTASTAEPLPTLGPRFHAFVLVRVGDVRDDPVASPYVQQRIRALRASTRTLERPR